MTDVMERCPDCDEWLPTPQYTADLWAKAPTMAPNQLRDKINHYFAVTMHHANMHEFVTGAPFA